MKNFLGLVALILILSMGCLNTTATATPEADETVSLPSRTIEGKIVAIIVMTLYEETAFPEGVADEFYFVEDSTGSKIVLHAALPADITGRFIIGDRIHAQVSQYGEVLSLRHTK